MQFSQLSQLQSFKQNMVLAEMPVQIKHEQSVHAEVGSVQASQQFYTILDQIQQINQARSAYFSLIDQNTYNNYNHNHNDNNLLPNNTQDKIQDNKQQEVQQQIPFSTPVILTSVLMHRKSNMFASTHNPNFKKTKIGDYKYTNQHKNNNNNNTIQIYYFGQPVYKFIDYSQNTTIDTVINQALTAYIKDLSLDQTYIVTTDYKKYDLRFPKDQGACKPDLNVQPISRDRVIVDSLFQVLVLVIKDKSHKQKHKQVQSLKVSKNGLSDSIQLAALNQIKVHIMNQVNTVVASLILNKDDILEKALEYLQGEFKQKIILTQAIQDDVPLPQDIQIRNLSTYRLYVKKRKFLDQPEKQKIPLKIISSIPKDLSPKALPPIGITQASRYEQFEVIKINSRGVEQPRILGIDQTKIYNYDVSVRKSKGQASFFSRIMGNSPITGTKKPQRLISEIIGVTPLSGYNFEILFPEKRILYITDSQEKKFKILRKLRFLIQFNNQNKSKNS